jgi:hypothetical protein
MAVAGDDEPSRSPGHSVSKARAIAADALPAPTTTVRPGTAVGSAAAIARCGIGGGERGVEQGAGIRGARRDRAASRLDSVLPISMPFHIERGRKTSARSGIAISGEARCATWCRSRPRLRIGENE